MGRWVGVGSVTLAFFFFFFFNSSVFGNCHFFSIFFGSFLGIGFLCLTYVPPIRMIM